MMTTIDLTRARELADVTEDSAAAEEIRTLAAEVERLQAAQAVPEGMVQARATQPQPKGTPLPAHADHVAEIAIRLRRLGRLAGVADVIPEDDSIAVGAIFTVLGMMASAMQRAATQAPAPAPEPDAVPHPGSPEASAMIDSVLAEYEWPSNTKNAARAGYVAAKRLLRAAQQAQASEPVVKQELTTQASESAEALPPAYMLAKLQMVMPVMQEARDALTALSVAQCKLHGIALDLADRMDRAGTFSLDDWAEALAAQHKGQDAAPATHP